MKLVMGMVGCWCRPISILTDACKTRNEYRIMFRSTPTCPIPCMDADDALSSHKRNHIHMSWQIHTCIPCCYSFIYRPLYKVTEQRDFAVCNRSQEKKLRACINSVQQLSFISIYAYIHVYLISTNQTIFDY